MAKEQGLDRAPIRFQTFYFSHVLVVPLMQILNRYSLLFGLQLENEKRYCDSDDIYSKRAQDTTNKRFDWMIS